MHFPTAKEMVKNLSILINGIKIISEIKILSRHKFDLLNNYELSGTTIRDAEAIRFSFTVTEHSFQSSLYHYHCPVMSKDPSNIMSNPLYV